ncbi:MAG TPA: DUF4166 domain-containing protein [Rhizomicrobium sp.]|jgi:hypothetical protein
MTETPVITRRIAAAAKESRFRALVGDIAWQRLPQAVRRRFSRAPGTIVTYAGEITECHRTRFGRMLAGVCRLIGAPLPLWDDVAVASVVTVTEDLATGGQVWSRIYTRRGGFPQVIQSSKCFAGPTGLEEYLGYGFGIALTVSADTRGLHFHSDHYFLAAAGLRLRLPEWFGPGALTISHIDLGDGWFAFVLALRHAWFGEIVYQAGLFRERYDIKETSRD